MDESESRRIMRASGVLVSPSRADKLRPFLRDTNDTQPTRAAQMKLLGVIADPLPQLTSTPIDKHVPAGLAEGVSNCKPDHPPDITLAARIDETKHFNDFIQGVRTRRRFDQDSRKVSFAMWS